MKIVSLLICAVLLSGCSMFNAKTIYRVNGNSEPVLEISSPRYSVHEFEMSPDGTLKVKADTTGGAGAGDKILDIMTLGVTHKLLNYDSD